MRACGPFLLRKGDIIAAAHPSIHAVNFLFVEQQLTAPIIKTRHSECYTAFPPSYTS